MTSRGSTVHDVHSVQRHPKPGTRRHEREPPGPGHPTLVQAGPPQKRAKSQSPRSDSKDTSQASWNDFSTPCAPPPQIARQPTVFRHDATGDWDHPGLSADHAPRPPFHLADPMHPSKRVALEYNLWRTPHRPHDDPGSTSPYSTRPGQALSHTSPPPVGSVRTHTPSADYRSAQRTPRSSPNLVVSTPNPLTQRPLTRHSLPLHEDHDTTQVGTGPADPLDPGGTVHPHPQPPPYPPPPANLNPNTKILLEPETRPISQEQLVNEVKGIYAGLVMVEKKCVEICQQQSQSTTKLSDQQWQALIALHRTLLHEHHDFFLASQHPTATPALRRLPMKYAMPARMWRHGIHAFLELLRHRLPHSLEHMLSFVYLAYQMTGLLMESVPAFHETWIECLGDLARYRMAIEETDVRDRENWSNVARMWYNRAADRSPNIGRIQHHLAVLARPNMVRQLFYYSKALVSVVPFTNARDSIMLLFQPCLDSRDTTEHPSTGAENALVTAAATWFVHGSTVQARRYASLFLGELDTHIARSGSHWKVQGAEIASALIACILDFGTGTNPLWTALQAHSEMIKGPRPNEPGDPSPAPVADPVQDRLTMDRIHDDMWTHGPLDTAGLPQAMPPPIGDRGNVDLTNSEEVTSYVLPVWSACTSIVAARVGDRNTLTFMHVTLAFLWSLTYVPGAMFYLEHFVPWTKLALSLNTLSRSGVIDAHVESTDFPQQRSGTGRQLPEDFLIRGVEWAQYYFPPAFFEDQVVDEDERTLELPSHASPRAERCLWLGIRLASLNRYLVYDVKSKQFSCTDHALSLSNAPVLDSLNPPPPTMGAGALDVDAPMVDVAELC